MAAAKKLVRSYTVLLRAEDTKEAKGSAKANNAYVRAEAAFTLCKEEYISSYKHYEGLISEVSKLYMELAEAEEGSRAIKKITAELARFEAKEEAHKDALEKKLSDAALAVDMPESEPEAPAIKATGAEASRAEAPREEAPACEAPRCAGAAEAPRSVPGRGEYREERYEHYAPPFYYGNSYPPHIAPASIDISGIVEDAVRAAMGKFVSVFEKRMNEYEAKLSSVGIGTYTAPAASSASAPVLNNSGKAAEIGSAVILEEERLSEKMREIVEKLNTVSSALTEIGASAIALASAQAEAAEELKRANDMQRRTARDIQGVLVNQKLISGEAAELVGAQAAAIEEQKANIENQKLIGASQAEIAEMEKSLIEASAALSETAKELIAAQKALISQQSSLINSNAKNVDAQRDLSERQAEVTSLLKTAEKEHRALTKEPRKKNTKSKITKDAVAANGGEAETFTEVAEEIIAVAVSAEATPAPVAEATTEEATPAPVAEAATEEATPAPVAEAATEEATPAPEAEAATEEATPAPVAEAATEEATPAPVAEAATEEATPAPVAEAATEEATPAPEAEAATEEATPAPEAEAATEEATPAPVAEAATEEATSAPVAEAVNAAVSSDENSDK